METAKKGLQEFLLSITIRIPCGPIHSMFHSLHHFLHRKLTVAKLQKSDSCADQYNYSQRDNDDHSASRIDHNPDLGRKSSVAIRRLSGLENPLRSAQCELLGGRMILQVRHHL